MTKSVKSKTRLRVNGSKLSRTPARRQWHAKIRNRSLNQLRPLGSFALLLLFVALLNPSLAKGQLINDPLSSAYLPRIDMNPQDYPPNVWTTDGMVKVNQNTGSPGPVKWALPYAAKNEWEGFQIHERAFARPVVIDDVTVSDLVNAPTGTRILASTNIVVYREAYINILTLSDLNGTRGFVPDILIPAVDPYSRQRTNAFPFTMDANKNQSFWVDILVPPDAPSGYYQGTVVIRNNGAVYASLPVLLAVWDFSIPSTTTLKTEWSIGWDTACIAYYGSYGACGAYKGAGGNADQGVRLSDIDETMMYLDHRTSLSTVVYGPPTDNNWTTFNALYGPVFNGTSTGRTQPFLSGAKLTTIQYQGSGIDSIPLQSWVANFFRQGWISRLFNYTCDEPPAGCSWADINTYAAVVHRTNPNMSTLVTTDITKATKNGVASSIDIMVPIINDMEPRGGSNQRSKYDAWLSETSSRQLWMYQSCESQETCSNGTVGPITATWPSLMIDASPVRNRVFAWMAYLYNVTGYLYYAVDSCWRATCSDGAGASGTDPWKYIYQFGGNGDGTITYPGTPARIGVTSPVPIPSVRLKLQRDGMEDYEYLIALDKAGLGRFALACLKSFISNAYTFNDSSEDLQNARKVLGNRLHELAIGAPVLTPPANLTVVVN